MSEDKYSDTWISRLKERTGRRRSDQILGWIRLLKEVVIVLAIIYLAATGGNLGGLL